MKHRLCLMCLGLMGFFVHFSAHALNKIDHDLVQQVFQEICTQGIEEPQWVMRQAIFETGWMRGTFLMQKNNLFGFRKVKYLQFETWQQSVTYYKEWQVRNYKTGKESYGDFLKRIRYGAKDYLVHLHKIQWTQNCPEPLQQAADPKE